MPEVSLSLSNGNPSRPWPEEIIQELGGDMTYVDTVDGRRLYCVRDWVYWVSGSTNKQRFGPWKDLKRAILSEGSFKVSDFITVLDIQTAGGPQATDFTDARGLFLITQRMADKSKVVRKVKKYLADSGVFVDEIRLDPDAGIAALEDHKEYKRLIASGFSPVEARQWIQRREKGIVTRKEITAVWSERGAKGRDYADLTNQATDVAIGKTATQLRRELTIKRKDSLRPHLSTMELTELDITETLAKGLHIERDSLGRPELSEDIEDVRPIMNAARPEIEKAFSKKRPRRA